MFNLKNQEKIDESVFQRILKIGIHMGLLILIQFFLVFILGLLFGLGPESTMKGWIEVFTLSPILAVFSYHFYKFRKEYKKLFFYSLSNIALLFVQLYLYIEILRWDLGYGFLIILLVGILTPLNFLLIDLASRRISIESEI